MRKINAKATKVLNTLTKDINSENTYKKVNNAEGCFMAVVVEDVTLQYGVNEGQFISIAHYFEQNGDLMADPEMVFWKPTDYNDKTVYYPVYYKMDGFGTEEISVLFEKGKMSGYYKRMQKDHAVFAGTWMENIKYQQNI